MISAAVKIVARGRTRPAKGMNKTEAEYREMLWARQRAGEILYFAYEAITLKLGDDLRYTPDFGVLLANYEFEFHECKGGFEREDARAKRIAAAQTFPFRFILARKVAGAWEISEI